MNTIDQQLEEIEALGAIYQEHEIEIINGEYPEIELFFTLSSATQGAHENSDDFTLKLSISLPKDYPDVIPEMRLQEWEQDFSETTIENLISKLNGIAEENLGMVMIFTVISALQDEIGNLIEERKQEKERLFDMEKKKEEEKEQKKFVGTAVTPESFKKWKEEFDKERMALKAKQVKDREAALAGKLTGRQQFLKDATLNLSDATIINDSADVDIDESLFDDLEGLDMEDE